MIFMDDNGDLLFELIVINKLPYLLVNGLPMEFIGKQLEDYLNLLNVEQLKVYLEFLNQIEL